MCTVLLITVMVFIVFIMGLQPKRNSIFELKLSLNPLFPALNIFACIYLLTMFDVIVWIRFIIWMLIGKISHTYVLLYPYVHNIHISWKCLLSFALTMYFDLQHNFPHTTPHYSIIASAGCWCCCSKCNLVVKDKTIKKKYCCYALKYAHILNPHWEFMWSKCIHKAVAHTVHTRDTNIMHNDCFK